MFNLIPLQVKIAVFLLLIGGAATFGYMKGAEKSKDVINSYKIEAERKISDLEKKNSEISNKALTRYIDKIRTVREKEYVYVDAAQNSVPGQYDVSNGWVFTHDVAASGGNADSTRSADASPSGVKDNQALTTVIRNYSICTQNSNQLEELQRWINDNKKAVDESNKSNNNKKRFGVF